MDIKNQVLCGIRCLGECPIRKDYFRKCTFLHANLYKWFFPYFFMKGKNKPRAGEDSTFSVRRTPGRDIPEMVRSVLGYSNTASRPAMSKGLVNVGRFVRAMQGMRKNDVVPYAHP